MGEAKKRRQHGQSSPKAIRQRRRKWMSYGTLVIAVIAVIGTVLWMTDPDSLDRSPLPEPSSDAFPEDADQYGIAIGNEDAPVVVREFADYQCPACAEFAQTHERLREEYIKSGQVRLVVFDLPLRQHDNAIPAAEAARCARDQRAWREMNQLLFENQSDWDSLSDPQERFTAYAEALDLDSQRFGRCLATEFHREAVEDSADLAQRLRITSTPTVMVDNVTLTRNNWSQLSDVIERELARAEESESDAH